MIRLGVLIGRSIPIQFVTLIEKIAQDRDSCAELMKTPVPGPLM